MRCHRPPAEEKEDVAAVPRSEIKKETLDPICYPPRMNTEKQLLSPANLNQLVTVRAGQVLAQELPELAGLVRVTGTLADLGRASGQWHYGVTLKGDDGARVLVDLPVGQLASHGLRAGQRVEVTGIVCVRTGHHGTIELRVSASSVEPAGAPRPKIVADTAAPAGNSMTREEVDRLAIEHRPFPVTNRALRIALIQSGSLHAQVAEDCLAEINKLGPTVCVSRVQVNMLDPGAIAHALRTARGDIVMLIRGGGDAGDFEVFDDRRVIMAMAEQSAYRVIGLGHSGNMTLLDRVADFTARTPAQAGMHVRESVQQVLAQWQARKEKQRNPSPKAFSWKRRIYWLLPVGLAAGAALILALSA